MKNILLWSLICHLLAGSVGCDRSSPPAPAPTSQGERVFDTRGVVRDIAASRRKAVIRHEEIPGYMPRMVMELTVRDTNEMVGIAIGDEITFRLHATADTHWIDTIRRVGLAKPETGVFQPLFIPKAAPELNLGDAVPDQEFLSETGRRMRFSAFRGRALAFTFFFTRCPLPDYCPRMNKNFSEAREILYKQPNSPTNWQFLCVSFDAEFDQPAMLAGYSKMFRGANPDRWLFAAASPDVLAELAPRLDLKVAREAGSFSHNLRTVVLDPQGRIFKQFDGNEWTAQQLAEAVADAARKP
jgi:protein SCO1/2